MPSGGYHPPAEPAMVSGPGANSARTDGGPADKQAMSVAPGQAYGERKAQLDAQRTAPLPASAPVPDGQPVNAPVKLPEFAGGLMGPTAYPDRPITHGVDIGAGAGSEALQLPGAPAVARPDGWVTRQLEALSATDTTGLLGQLYMQARTIGA